MLQLHTNNLEKCHPNEEAAKASCPSRQEIRERKASEMMLYKTRCQSKNNFFSATDDEHKIS